MNEPLIYYVEPLTGLVLHSGQMVVLYWAILCFVAFIYWLISRLDSGSSYTPPDAEDYQRDAARLRAESDYLDARAQHAASQAAYEDLEKYLKRRR